MGIPDVPNWVRILLLLASVLSFAPQFYHTISRRNSTGISTLYVLFNLISTTEQFTLTFLFVVNSYPDGSDIFVHSPRNTGDWINLVQMSIVLLLWLTAFVVCLWLPSAHRDCSVAFAIGTYVAFLLISVVPIFDDVIHPVPPHARRWFVAMFGACHTLFLSWIVTALNIAAIYCQVRETLSRPQDTALSRIGLAAQAVVFGLLAISWVGRVRFKYEWFPRHFWYVLKTWYEMVGWAAVDTGIFALGQAIIYWAVSRQGFWGGDSVSAETEPLLHS